MGAVDIAGISHGVAALAYGLLAISYTGQWRTRVHAAAMAAACLSTALWAAAVNTFLAAPAETMRSAAWIVLLMVLLRPSSTRLQVYVACLAGLALLTLASRFATLVLMARLGLAVLGMALIEQVYRNTPQCERWAVKFACLGVGAIFAYDFFIYSEALLFHDAQHHVLAARGIVDAFAVPLLALSAARNPRWASGVVMSRTMMFHGAVLIGALVYLAAVASGGYYLRHSNGDWGRVLQYAFNSGAALIFIAAVASGALRARLRVFINKHFYAEQFDYREAWRRFTRTLSGTVGDPGAQAVEAVAALIDSPAGVLWVVRNQRCEATAAWKTPLPRSGLRCDDALCVFLAQRQWVIDVAECRAHPERYGQLVLPPVLQARRQCGLVVPLVLQGDLFGFMLLDPPQAPFRLDWEVTDLLKIAGSQAATVLACQEAAQALAVARQFESFNRMSAFIVHDLKNLVFQFSLLLSNADKHHGNPRFQADLLSTLDHSVRKMRCLLNRLNRGETPLEPSRVLYPDVLARLARQYGLAPPSVRDPGLTVMADAARLERVLGHMVQNAIDAGASCVALLLQREGTLAVLEIRDDGQGMSEAFLRDKLFRPFESAKPSGMGIGMFESRAYIVELGGGLDVTSAPGAGTTCRVVLPLVGFEEVIDEQEKAVGG